MIYTVVQQSPKYRQITIDEMLWNTFSTPVVVRNETNTHTYVTPESMKTDINPDQLVHKLKVFNESYSELRKANRHDLYHTFFIPKSSGGMRRIDAPQQNLMSALRDLKKLFEEDFHVLYHTSAHAYVHGRSIMSAMKRHQQNESKWFLKLDLHNFFGSTTIEFVMNQLSMIYPFNEVIAAEDGRDELTKALDLAFLDGGLPQGTPISPLITNVMMIPIDFWITKTLRDFEGNSYVYTRYADDFTISSKYSFKFVPVREAITGILKQFNAPFEINAKKTRYGSSSGSNWNLGLMLNKDNDITVGYKNKRNFKSMLVNYLAAKARNENMPIDELQHIIGLHSYYRMIERETIDAMVKSIDNKFGTNVIQMIKKDISRT